MITIKDGDVKKFLIISNKILKDKELLLLIRKETIETSLLILMREKEKTHSIIFKTIIEI